MAAMLCDLQPGDEVIMPSFTFVSTANAFVRCGATPVFVDICPHTLNLDAALIEEALSERTRAIVPVHYAGVGCDMDRIMTIAEKHNLIVVEDAAQAVNARYNDKYLGTIGHLGCYSFHETKNYICGEGGALCINDPHLTSRAAVIRDKGTNRQQFLSGEIDKYTWIDDGSSYVPSELCSAFLWGQLEHLTEITTQRRHIYRRYRQALRPLESNNYLQLPVTPEDCRSNYHMFYILLPSGDIRDALLHYLQSRNIHAVLHYVPLHSSPRGRLLYPGSSLPVTDNIAARLLRLPFFYSLEPHEQARVTNEIADFLYNTRESPCPVVTHAIHP